MSFQIIWYSADSSSQSQKQSKMLIMGDRLEVGREFDADIQLVDEQVSRAHAEIWADKNGVHIQDRGSANGTRLSGRDIVSSKWLPGEILSIGPYSLELRPMTAQSYPTAGLDGSYSSQSPSDHYNQSENYQSGYSVISSRMDPVKGKGRIELNEVFLLARRNDKSAIRELFLGFLGTNETVVDCGYLGSAGFIFPEHSFWCVTDNRVCGLGIDHWGWMNFNFASTKKLDRGVFNQPSLIWLWVTVGIWAAFMILMPFYNAVLYIYEAIRLSWGWGVVLGLLFLLIVGIGVVLIPWVVRVYYRLVKAGCVFFTLELVPLVVFADRSALREAQRFLSVFSEQKQRMGG